MDLLKKVENILEDTQKREIKKKFIKIMEKSKQV